LQGKGAAAQRFGAENSLYRDVTFRDITFQSQPIWENGAERETASTMCNLRRRSARIGTPQFSCFSEREMKVSSSDETRFLEALQKTSHSNKGGLGQPLSNPRNTYYFTLLIAAPISLCFFSLIQRNLEQP
jgi:hypothetical protein